MSYPQVLQRTKVSDSDIIPDEYQNKLLYLRDLITDAEFTTGDIANDLALRSAEKGLSVTNSEVYAAVGRFVGKAGRTIRYYAETARFFDVGVREKYEMLPFSFFAFAKTAGDRWVDVLDYAMAKPHITCRGLEVAFSKEELFYPDRDSVVGSTAERLATAEQGEVSHNKSVVAGVALSKLSDLLESVDGLVESIALDTDTKQKLQEGLSLIRECVPELAQVVSKR